MLLIDMNGQAGTGKTLMALAAGLEQVFKYHRYERILITRPIMPMGKVHITSIVSAAVSDK
jgi:PhoH-like ATPase